MSAKLSKKYPNVKFYGPCTIKRNVQIGDGTGIGEYCVIGENAKIGKNCRILYHVIICKDAIIGDNVFIGPMTALLNDKYPPTKKSEPPIIEDDVIVGGGCTILPSVRIGRKAVIAAGSTVVMDVQSEILVICEGTCVTYCSREEYDRKRTLKSLEKLGYV